tara:strand:+ start:22 stop:708 length:687 start_codon:yes stop_codon:yes gene_type:complete
MKVVIHQPQFFPYPGFFHKLSLADKYVVLDNTQYDKRFTNRNQISEDGKPLWITVPINKKHKFSSNNQVEINNEIKWQDDIWKKIYHSYKNTKFFSQYEEYLEKIFTKKWTFLFELNFETLKKTLEWLDIQIEIIKESDLEINSTSTQRLIDICEQVNADTYISGKGLPNKKYIEEDLFKNQNIKLEFQNYSSVSYQQKNVESFIPDLSILDLLFNCGKDSQRIIRNV